MMKYAAQRPHLVALLLIAGLLMLSACGGSAPSTEQQAESMIGPGERIVFFGDSITEMGDQPGGYVSIIRDSLNARYPQNTPEVIGAGIGGDRVPDLQERVQLDVLDHDPSLVVIYIGINDVWHQFSSPPRGTDPETYEEGLRDVVDQIQESGADVVVCTPSVIGENMDEMSEENVLLQSYAEVSREVASDAGAPVCDLNEAFTEHLEQNNPDGEEEGVLTTDRVHLNDAGNQFVAQQILQSLGW